MEFWYIANEVLLRQTVGHDSLRFFEPSIILKFIQSGKPFFWIKFYDFLRKINAKAFQEVKYRNLDFLDDIWILQ
jgi:hypothetical protein